MHCRNTFLQGFISCKEPAPGYASVDLRVEKDLKMEDVLDDMSVVYTCIYIVYDSVIHSMATIHMLCPLLLWV